MNSSVSDEVIPRTIRVGVLGNAAIFRHAVGPSLLDSHGGELVAIASRGQLGEGLGSDVRKYEGETAYRDLIDDPEIDAIYVPLPNHLHAEWTLAALRAGKHVLCEKPLGVNAEEAESMVSAAQELGVHLVEAFMYRHNPQHERVRQLLSIGEIGELQLVRVNFTVPIENPSANVRFAPHDGAGALYDVGCYGINLARWMYGAEPSRAHTFAANLEGTTADILHTVNLEFPGGKFASVTGGLGQAYGSTYELIGTKGKIQVQRPFASPPFVPQNSQLVTTITVDDIERVEMIPDDNRYITQWEEFFSLLTSGESAIVDLSDAVNNQRVLDAALKSVESGRAEKVA